jgi:primary-amine oxidase
MDSVCVAQRESSHPLDPLSQNEITLAAAIVRASHDLGAGMQVETIVLHEPVDTAAFEARRALPRIAPDEFLLAEQIAKSHPDFLAALAKRGIVDVSLVCSDPWSCGVFGHPDEVGRRQIQTITWVRNHPHDNPTLDVPPPKSAHSCCA